MLQVIDLLGMLQVIDLLSILQVKIFPNLWLICYFQKQVELLKH